jgi:uncharacterized lipoprotein YajG
MMNRNIAARAIRASLLVVRLVASLGASILLLSGCAFTTGHVNLAYEPTTEVSKAATADSPRVRVEVTDKRPTQAVGQKINGFGMKTADIVSNSDVAATLKTAFETELHNRGFTDGVGGDLVTVRLADFQNQFTLGFFSGDASATIGMDVAVKRPDGSVTYSRYITGESKDWIELAGEGNAERMLNGAMRDGVAKVFSDNKFIDALNKR